MPKMKITMETVQTLAAEARQAGHHADVAPNDYVSWDGCVTKERIRVDVNGSSQNLPGGIRYRAACAFLVGVMENNGGLSDFARQVRAEITESEARYIYDYIADGMRVGATRDSFVDAAHAEAVGEYLRHLDKKAFDEAYDLAEERHQGEYAALRRRKMLADLCAARVAEITEARNPRQSTRTLAEHLIEYVNEELTIPGTVAMTVRSDNPRGPIVLLKINRTARTITGPHAYDLVIAAVLGMIDAEDGTLPEELAERIDPDHGEWHLHNNGILRTWGALATGRVG